MNGARMSILRIASTYRANLQKKAEEWFEDAEAERISHRKKAWMREEALELADIIREVQARNWQLFETDVHWIIVASSEPVKRRVPSK